MHPLHRPVKLLLLSFSTEFFRSIDQQSFTEKPRFHFQPGNSTNGFLLANIFHSMTSTLSAFFVQWLSKIIITHRATQKPVLHLSFSLSTQKGLFALVPP